VASTEAKNSGLILIEATDITSREVVNMTFGGTVDMTPEEIA
ncbi:8193_t:CDS:1, partial [Racocetra fulgida]